MAYAPFEPIRFRLDEADGYYLELYDEIEAFLKTDPYGVAREFNEQERKWIWRGVIKKQVPDKARSLAGQCVKAMRSGLDHLAWELALLNTQNPRQTTAFPIFLDPSRYAKDKLRFIGDVAPAAHAIFDAVQPGNRSDTPATDPLWILHRLANDDKHKGPVMTGAIPVEFGVRFPGNVEGRFLEMRVGSFEDGDEIAGLTYRDWIPDDEMYGQAQFTFGVGFGKKTAARAIDHALAEILWIRTEVGAVIDKFGAYFPGSKIEVPVPGRAFHLPPFGDRPVKG